MEIKDYKIETTNLKISVQLPQEVSLEFVEDRCKFLQLTGTNIYCRRKIKNLLSVRYKNFTYVLFKRSSKVTKGITPPQHCNITRLKSESNVIEAIEHLFFVVDQPQTFLNYTVDCYSCIADTHQEIDISAFYLIEKKIRCTLHEEGFPALVINCPQELKKVSKNLTCMVYKSGKVILVGGKNQEEIRDFFNWVVKILQKYST